MNKSCDKVIDIALKENGYLEKKDGNLKYLYDKTANAGNANYTKYGYEMHKVYPQVMDYPAYWCDAFVDWCFYTAYGVTTAKSLLGGNFDDYTVASCQMYKNKGALYENPERGDQVFFTRNGQVSGCHHTGLVYKKDGLYFYTAEGNTSGASGVVRNGGGVALKKYSIAAYKGKVLFGRPKYDKSVTPKPQESTGGTLNKTKKWTGIVTASELNVRSWAGTGNDILRVLKQDTKVSVCDSVKASDGVKWYYIKKDGKYGFVSSKYIKRV